jgi:hypothetical protein
MAERDREMSREGMRRMSTVIGRHWEDMGR